MRHTRRFVMLAIHDALGIAPHEDDIAIVEAALREAGEPGRGRQSGRTQT